MRRNTLQDAAVHCNTLQHAATHPVGAAGCAMWARCSKLQHAATRCNTLQPTLQHTLTPTATPTATHTHKATHPLGVASDAAQALCAPTQIDSERECRGRDVAALCAPEYIVYLHV